MFTYSLNLPIKILKITFQFISFKYDKILKILFKSWGYELLKCPKLFETTNQNMPKQYINLLKYVQISKKTTYSKVK